MRVKFFALVTQVQEYLELKKVDPRVLAENLRATTRNTDQEISKSSLCNFELRQPVDEARLLEILS